MRSIRPWAVLCAALLSACSGRGDSRALPPYHPPQAAIASLAYDRLDGVPSCEVSADGFIWYTVPAGVFAPIDIGMTRCPAGSFGSVTPPVPSWAVPRGPTRAVFTAASLLGPSGTSAAAISAMASVADPAAVPLTWLVDHPWDAATAAALDARHARGDEVDVAPPLTAAARARWPWFRGDVAVLGAGTERDIAAARAAGARAFWGITWNSLGVDATEDRGAPPGLFCADASSYKRPSPNGDCSLASIEWTARDLTGAYLTEREDAYSTDPDDVRLRAGFGGAAATAYANALVDAYAAAGETMPLLMVAQQEGPEQAGAPEDVPFLDALYRRARADGMMVTTFSGALDTLLPSAAAPRAFAFPALPMLGRRGPGTIDAHDTHIGLTFRAGETTPSRVFAFDAATSSSFRSPVPQLPQNSRPQLVGASASGGVLTLRYRSPVATRYAAAFWSDPALMGWTSPNVVPAGRAGAVAFFDLPAGDATITLGCAACTGAAFPYAGT